MNLYGGVPERMANIKFIAVSRSLSGILDYVTNREKTVERLISGVNCMAQTAQDEFEAVKKQFRKTDGRSYYHIVQAFAPDDPLGQPLGDGGLSDAGLAYQARIVLGTS